MKTNYDFATHIICQLLKWGVAEFYVCAGARNLPLVEVLLALQVPWPIVFHHFEERCAAFYAIGRIKSLGKPVAVVTTSGTAVGELLAPTMEAYYSGLPLVLLTADRPKMYRKKGLPQSAEQKDIFGQYVSACFDLDAHDHDFTLAQSPHHFPLHINACFQTPLQQGKMQTFRLSLPQTQNSTAIKLSAPQKSDSLVQFLKTSQFPLVVVGQLNANHKQVAEFLQNLNVPVYLEPLSQLRECAELSHLQIRYGEKIWEHAHQSGYPIDAILKIGHTPTHKFWRNVEEVHTHVNVLSIGEHIFPGHSRATHIHSPHLDDWCQSNRFKKDTFELAGAFFERDRQAYHNLCHLLELYPQSEAALVSLFSQWVEPQSRIYLGNSLPIRHWDLSATYLSKNLKIEASRGLNGIDGQLSTFFGYAKQGSENWALIGDLTALYDLAAPWALQYARTSNINIIILNNGGGKIFESVLTGKGSLFIQNNHSLNFKHWAAMWNLNYTALNCFDAHQFAKNKNQCSVFELFPVLAQTQAFNLALKNL